MELKKDAARAAREYLATLDDAVLRGLARYAQIHLPIRLVIPDRAMGLPVLRALSLCTCCRHYPGAATGRRLRSSRPAVSAFPENVVGLACTSSFSRLARRLLALRPAHSRSHLYVTSYTEGFSHFVTSMTAPVASGWSVRRVGLAPTGKRRLVTAHTLSGVVSHLVV